MGLSLSRSHVDQNRREVANPNKTEQSPNQEPESSPGTEQTLAPGSEETGRQYGEHSVILHKAALQGNWKRAEKSIKCGDVPNLPNIAITEGGETALHLAAAGGHLHFVKQLLIEMEVSSLEIKNKNGQTALCYAAIGGHAKIAEQMLKKNADLIRSEGYRPLFYAAWEGNKTVANYLFKESIHSHHTAVGGSSSYSRPEEDQVAVEESVHQSRPEEDHIAVGESVSHHTSVGGSTSYSRPEQDQTADGQSVCQSRPEEDQVADEESVHQSRPEEDRIAVGEYVSHHTSVGGSTSYSRPEQDQTADGQSVCHSRPEDQIGESASHHSRLDEDQIVEEYVSQTQSQAREDHKRSVFSSWTKEHQLEVLFKCIHSGLYDLAVKILNENKELALAEHRSQTPLLALSKKSLAFRSTSLQRRWRNITSTIHSYFWEASYDDAYILLDTLWKEVINRQDVETPFGDRFKQLLFSAAEYENDGFLIELIRRHPDFLYKYNPLQQTIFHIAVLHRSVDVYNLSYELPGVKDILIQFIDDDNNNILHLAAKLPHQNQLNTTPGAALQMQREVLWYKEVEKIVPPDYIIMKNNEVKTPGEIFSADHEKLMKEGEKQIKQIAKACMLVTTIITTIVFTTAFTAPGGYSDKGTPNLQHNKFFMVLPISQAISTLASLFSMLMFLSVLSSRFSENDFLKSLPLCLVVGVVSLFLSIVAMMVAFCRCLFFYEPGLAVKVAFLLLFGIVPFIFLVLKFHLFFSIISCTFSSAWLFRSKNRLFI